MSEDINPSVLQRMVGRGAATVTEVPVTASRAMRLAVTRAAERTIGLQVTVNGVSEDVLTLEGVQSALRDDLLLLKLKKRDDLIGVLALDANFIAAIVEVQTTGQVGSAAPEPRPVTLIDLMLAQPVLNGLFAQLLETTPQTALDGWTTDVTHVDRFDDVRAIGLALAHVDYRLMRMAIDLGGSDRTGELLLALPCLRAKPAPAEQAPSQADWAETLRATVYEAPAALTAVLHRFDLPLHTANDLRVGQVLALPGCTVNSVTLVGPDGIRVARAKLGQAAGHIAVRLENPIAPFLKELPTPPRVNKPNAALTLSDNGG